MVFAVVPLWADRPGAEQVVVGFEARMEAWASQVKGARTVEERRALWESVPDAREFGEKLLREIDGSWDQEWVLDYTYRLLDYAPVYSMQPVDGRGGRTPLGVIRDSANKFLFQSDKLGPLMVALTLDPGPKTREFLERVERSHPNRRVQGYAALGLAMLMEEMGEGGGIAARRLQLIRKAVIESADARVGKRTVGEVAKGLLKTITELEKGMTPPDLLGWNVKGEAMRLSDFRGKPVVLVFWHTRMRGAEETLNYLKKIEGRLGVKGVQVLGVANESVGALREMVKDGTVTWKNFVDEKGELAKEYQLRSYPAAWVLDKSGKVQYKGVPGSFLDLTAEALLE
ncbi:MAG: TlpA disulfide reductase family protein [Verrucomicrobiota bacterium]